MGNVTGTLLVLASWGALVALVVLLGLGPAHLLADSPRRGLPVRASLWWGLTFLVLLLLATSPFLAASSPGTLSIVLVIALASGVPVIVRWARHRGSVPVVPRPSGAVAAYVVALLLAMAYLAFKALGPVTHFDAGLYQLGAVRYAAEFPTLHGLALLSSPFGYSNSHVLLGGFLSGGPWGPEGFRLVNGLIIAAVCIDLAVRLITRRYTWGTFILLVGVTSLAFPFLAMADFWVTSPTSDTALLFLSLITVSYLADFLSERQERTTSAAVALATIVVSCSMRPTMAAFGLAVAAVLVRATLKDRGLGRTARGSAWVLPAAAGLIAAGLIAVRDYLLSGWLAFPLTFFHWQVPWLAPDPTGLRDATLAAARDPQAADGYVTAHSWSWIGPWVSRLGQQWEPYYLTAAVLLAIGLCWWARRTGARLSWRLVGLCSVPGLVGTVFWFLFTPPSFRFGWGPLLTLPLITIGAALAALVDRRPLGVDLRLTGRFVLAGAAALVVLVAFCVVDRSQVGERTATGSWDVPGVQVPYTLAPTPIAVTNEVALATGLTVLTPETDGQCWATWPLCTYQYEPRLALRGDGLADGFILVEPSAAQP